MHDIIDVDLGNKFPVMSYAEAMRRYGSDRPDLRIPLELVDIADEMREVDFKVFSGPANDPHGRVVAMRVPEGGDLSRSTIDELTKFVGIYGAKGLAYIKVNDLAAGMEGLQSPIVKFCTGGSLGQSHGKSRRRKRRPDFLRRRQGPHRQRSHGRVARQARALDRNLFDRRLEALMGHRLPHVRLG